METFSSNNTLYEPSDNEGVSTIAHIIFQVLLFCLGLLIQIKIIILCKNERDERATWQIDICHAIVQIIFFAFAITLEGFTHFIPVLSQLTGDWLCYMVTFVTFYCYYSIVAHSLMISIMKYVYIVQNQWVSKIGKTRVLKWFLWANLAHPLFLTFLTILTSDWDLFSSLNKCFGQKEDVFSSQVISVSSIKKLFLCELKNGALQNHEKTFGYVLKQLVCATQTIVNLIINTNLIEAWFYYKIFRKIRW